jgi:hypothetical protein
VDWVGQNVDKCFCEHVILFRRKIQCFPSGTSNSLGSWHLTSLCDCFFEAKASYQLVLGSILLWTTSRGDSSGIAGWTVTNNGDVSVIIIVVTVDAAHLQGYLL